MEMSVLALIIWGEITFLLAGGLALLITLQWMQKRKEKKSAQDLILKVDNNRQKRQEEIRQGLSAYGLEGELLDEKAAQIDKQELKLYQHIVSMYRSRSPGMLSNINVAVESSTRPYYELDISLQASKAGADATDDTAASEQASGEMEALQQKNQELELELGVAMETIGRMLSEYSSLFSSESDEQTDLDKNKIMQAFSADQVTAQVQTGDTGIPAEEDEIVAVVEDAISDEEVMAEEVDVADTESEPAQAESMDTDQLLEIDDVLSEEASIQEYDELDVIVEDLSDEVKPETETDEHEAVEDEDLSDVSITDITEEMLGVRDEDDQENESRMGSAFDDVEEDLLGAVSLDDEDIAELEAAGLTDIVDDGEPSSEDEEVEVTDLDEFDIEKLLAENKQK